ncbi:alpha-1,2-fucosyltransferase [Mucilaginibacter sp.]|uniref:alpha-1,2-fucosyltransferase n=1 Tax=Mucilaginibacter sp. TaxID=1882438 RepID=UPI003D0CCAE7
MILTKLQGGLGNQMFQYAAARGLLKKESQVYLDHSFLDENFKDTEHFTARKYELHIFKNIKAGKATLKQINLFKKPSAYLKALIYFSKGFFRLLQQQGNEFVSLPNPVNNQYLYLDGYFQSEEYFKHCREELLKEFQFPELDLVNKVAHQNITDVPNAVSIHIRRGDYLKSKVVSDIHGVLPIDYYQKAIEFLQNKLSPLTLFVFSDDVAWAQANLSTDNLATHYINHNQGEDSWKDMALMSYCRHHIIANSSFSWWAAWLNPSLDKIVIAPKNWFSDPQLNSQSQTIIPDTWITL